MFFKDRQHKIYHFSEAVSREPCSSEIVRENQLLSVRRIPNFGIPKFRTPIDTSRENRQGTTGEGEGGDIAGLGVLWVSFVTYSLAVTFLWYT